MNRRSARHGKLAAALACMLAVAGAPRSVDAQDDTTPASLDALLLELREGTAAERATARQRERDFREARNRQRELVEEAEARLAKLEANTTALEERFEENEREITESGTRLAERLGTLGELFGTVRQVAGETAALSEASLVSAELGLARVEPLEQLARSQRLPAIAELEALWIALVEEMAEQGKVTRFRAPVEGQDGDTTEREVLRVGVFNLTSGSRFLQWNPETGRLSELGRQPAGRHMRALEGFDSSTDAVAPFPLDPGRGALLALLVETPGPMERVRQGGMVGYAILVLGAFGLVIALARLAWLTVVDRRVRRQRSDPDASANNPLGRVLAVATEHPGVDPESLALQLDAAVLRESAGLDRLLWAIKVISVMSPLMGLLGTVTGMIQTFQSITLFGTGDPRLMAGGISQALVTTMLGLLVAIPLVLLHSVIASTARRVVEVLDEQSAGLVAERAEAEGS